MQIIKFNNVAHHNALIKDEIMGAIGRVLDEDRLVLGKAVEDFEKEFGAYCGGECVSVASGTDAITLALKAIGIGKGNTVATVANSAPATVSAIMATGAFIVHAEVNQEGLMSAGTLAACLQRHEVDAIVPVWLYGRRCPLDQLLVVSKNTPIIVDAAQAAGERHIESDLERCEAMCFSFYPTKNLGALGDGGAVVAKTNRPLSDRIRVLRDYGMVHGLRLFGGTNSRLDTIQAAVLSVKLKYLGQWNKERAKLAAVYDRLLPDEVKRPPVAGENFHLYTIHHPKRDQLKKWLMEQGIETMIHYPYWESDLPDTMNHCQTVLSLPLWVGLKEEEVQAVAGRVREFCETV